jgi:hypothetical protein
MSSRDLARVDFGPPSPALIPFLFVGPQVFYVGRPPSQLAPMLQISLPSGNPVPKRPGIVLRDFTSSASNAAMPNRSTNEREHNI